MNITSLMAKQFRDVFYGGNWSSSCFKEQLADVTWEQATAKIVSCNTISVLVHHIWYYMPVVLRVLKGGPLQGKDSESFDCPPIRNPEDWQQLLERFWADAAAFADELERLPDSQLSEVFGDAKYGTYYRNLAGMVEHLHYHLGQIVLIKKMLQENRATSA